MNDLISVIIPVYNRETYLPDCMDAVFAQTHQNLQIILIDDGSTDGTAELCRQYAAEDPRVMFLAGQHGGVSAARNLGLDAASGEYVFFVDSDDAIHPSLLETLATAMGENNAQMGGTRVINVPQDQWRKVRALIKLHPAPGQTSFHPHEDTVHAVFHGGSPFGLIGGVMFRRDLIGQTRFRTDLFIGEDFYFIYQNLIKGASSVFLEQKWYYCRIHPSNSTRNYSLDAFQTRYLRRKLVWESEDALGRPENANVEKHSLFSAYLDAVKRNEMPPADRRAMCRIMKQNRKILLPALNFPRKVRFWMTVYFPVTHRVYCKILKK